MAKQQAAAGKQVAKKKGGGQMAAWEEELRALATEESERTPAGSGNWMKVSRQGFQHQGASLGRSITAIVVDHVFVNSYYDTPFDEDNPVPPACFAVSAKDKHMAPVESSPSRQSEGCDGCWANAWKSDDRQKGKACSNKKGLALLIDGDAGSELAFLMVGVTSTPNFNRYVKKLNDSTGLPVGAVLTKIFYDENAEVQKLLFTMEERLDRETWNKVKERMQEARGVLCTPPDFSGYAKPKGGKQAKPAARGGRDRGPAPKQAQAGRGRLS